MNPRIVAWLVVIVVVVVCMDGATTAFSLASATRPGSRTRTATWLTATKSSSSAAAAQPSARDDDSSRRDFLGHLVMAVPTPTLAAAATLSLGPQPAAGGEAALAETTSSSPSPSSSGAVVQDVEASSRGLAGNIQLPPLGLGAWSWGDSFFWGYDEKDDAELKRVFDYAIQNAKTDKTLLDTAEIYGLGRSERLIGQFSQDYPVDKVQVATKFAALPIRTKPNDVVKACQASLQRLGRPTIDLYQIHFPNAWSNAEYWDGLAMAYEQGLVQAVGVSNYGVDATRACHAALAKRGIQLATNQLQLSLLYRYPIENGLLQACQDLGIQVLSYSPLALGMLTGKYTADAMPSGPRKAVYQKLLTTPDYENLLSLMKDVAAVRPTATLSQVALNWTRAKKTIPIPGARTVSQIQQNYGALDWELSSEEVRALDVAAAKVKTFLTPVGSFFVKEDINTHLKMFDS